MVADVSPIVTAGPTRKYSFRLLFSDKAATLSLAFLSLELLGAIFWPMISPYDVTGRNIPHALLPPFTTADGQFYLLGTDGIGRDMFTRIMAGGRVSMSVAATVAVLSGVVGTALGIVSGFYRGRIDDFVVRVVDVFLALPTIFFVLVVLYVVGTSTINLIIVMGVASWMLYCRIARSCPLLTASKHSLGPLGRWGLQTCGSCSVT